MTETDLRSAEPRERLRPEAAPLCPEDLDEQQRFAFHRIVSLLDGAVAGVPRSRGSAGHPSSPQLRRTCNSFAVVGGRGLGKTTLLLSLRKALTDQDFRELACEQLAAASRALRHLPERLIWLEALDLDPLSDQANLLGAVLARVEHAIDSLRPDGHERHPRPSLLESLPEYHEARRDLGRLQRTVALAFDGNLDKRAGNLDSEAYALETRKAELERVDIGGAFARTLEKLSKVFNSIGRWNAPLFVLPIDDLDLYPRRCIDLLGLLRSVSSPYLVAILATDMKMLETVSRLTFEASLAEIAKPRELDYEARSQGRDLASEVLRKYLPPAHRVPLSWPEPSWILGFRPHDGAQPVGTRPLREILHPALPEDEASIWLEGGPWLAVRDSQPPDGPVAGADTSSGADTGRQSQALELAPFRIRSRGTLPAGKGLDCHVGPYSWPEVLRRPMRYLVDLYQDCKASHDSADQYPADQYPGGAGPNGTALSRFAKEGLRRWRDDLRELRDGTVVQARVSAPRPLAEQSPAGPPRPTVYRLDFEGWDVRLASGLLPSDEARRLVGCLELAGGEAGENLRPALRPYLRPLRESHLEDRPGQRSAAYPWPWVDHTTFWGYERAANWLRQADDRWQGQPDAAFGAWVAVMTAQLFDTPTDAADPLALPVGGLPDTWEKLAERLADLEDPQEPGERYSWTCNNWLLVVGLLCTPEMGMRQVHDVPWAVPRDLAEEVQNRRIERRQHLPAVAQWYVDSWSPVTASPGS
jgi:hypothetical protein